MGNNFSNFQKIRSHAQLKFCISLQPIRCRIFGWYELSPTIALFTCTALLTGLRHFPAPLGAENLSDQGKQVDNQKMPETHVNTGFMLFRAENPSLSKFEAIFLSVFV
jgi:hypothetical protein